jgi:hypothetical protein
MCAVYVLRRHLESLPRDSGLILGAQACPQLHTVDAERKAGQKSSVVPRRCLAVWLERHIEAINRNVGRTSCPLAPLGTYSVHPRVLC